MIFGMTPFTFFHVVLSLIGIAAGLVVMTGLLESRLMPVWTKLFLVTTIATTLTGFLFPFHGFTPAIGVGILSTLVLALALAARYTFHLAGIWRPVYVITTVIALYFNCFVLVVQSFLKVPPLHALAPNGNEPPFAIAQGVVLAAFLFFGYVSVKKFHPPAITRA